MGVRVSRPLCRDPHVLLKPEYGAIFQERLNGNQRPLRIAEALGLGESQTYDDVDRVRALAAELYRKTMDD